MEVTRTARMVGSAYQARSSYTQHTAPTVRWDCPVIDEIVDGVRKLRLVVYRKCPSFLFSPLYLSSDARFFVKAMQEIVVHKKGRR